MATPVAAALLVWRVDAGGWPELVRAVAPHGALLVVPLLPVLVAPHRRPRR